MALETKNFRQDWRPRAAIRVSESEAARMTPLRYFARPLRSIAKSHAEFTNCKSMILGKIGDSSMALKLHLAPAYEESNSAIAASSPDSNRWARLFGAAVRVIVHCIC